MVYRYAKMCSRSKKRAYRLAAELRKKGFNAKVVPKRIGNEISYEIYKQKRK